MTFTTRIILIALVFASLSGPIGAQVVSDPNDSLYHHLDQWEARGLIYNLPVLRPYSPRLVVELLQDVFDRGSRVDQMRAAEYLDIIDGFERASAVIPQIGVESSTFFDAASRTAVSLGAMAFTQPHELVDLTAQYQSLFLIGERNPGFLRGTRDPLDFVEDNAEIELGSLDISVRQSLGTVVTVGTSRIYGQAGYNRSSFGPFHDDGLVISPQTQSTANFSFVWRGDRWTYTNLLYLPVATNHRGGTAGLHSELDRYPDKYMMVRAVQWRALPVLDLAAWETIVWGRRLEPSYFIPTYSLFLAQHGRNSVSRDNSFIGLSATVRPGHGLVIPTSVYMGDLHFNRMMQGNILLSNTKYKLSAQTGIRWTPLEPGILDRLQLDYLAVMPYMYTHWDRYTWPEGTEARPPESPNYNNYTHLGENIGPTLDPNSDRLTLRIDLRPVPLSRVSVMGRMIRHGNASEGVEGINVPSELEGGLFDPGYAGSSATFQTETRFLTQDVIERTLQFGLDLEYDINIPGGLGGLRARAGYMFEHVANAGLVEGNSELNNRLDIGVTYRF
ncbi:MAG: hypothetical protein EA383_01005 [Spirochaetaceae bacterium]|nr:MAG: hypothetical protein EA383_01005 [Spirochaetaceae bacterium]